MGELAVGAVCSQPPVGRRHRSAVYRWHMDGRERICPGGHGTYSAEAEVCIECGSRLVVDRHGEVVADYVFDRLAGVGGMRSAVWEARRLRDETTVAVKVIEASADSTEARRLLKSAALLSGLYHQNLATLFDWGETAEGEAWVSMELLRGPTLRALLQQRRHLTVPQAVHVVREVLQALTFLHAHDIVHRDIKPANIHLTARAGGPWSVRLIDFGIARQSVARAPERLDLEEAPGTFGPVLGTPEYMAPEQILGHDVDARADLYAVGVVLYRLLVGELPFGPLVDKHALYERHLRHLPVVAADPSGQPLPLALGAALATALQKHPGRRFPSAESFILALVDL